MIKNNINGWLVYLYNLIQSSFFIGCIKRTNKFNETKSVTKTNEPQRQNFDSHHPWCSTICCDFIGHVEKLDNRLLLRGKILNQLPLQFASRRWNVVTLLRRWHGIQINDIEIRFYYKTGNILQLFSIAHLY